MSDTHCRYAFRVHGDVVKVTKSILQALKGRKELFASSHRPLCREQSGEEFRCIAQLFCLDAQLVAAGRIEPPKHPPSLANLSPASRQLLGRERLDREVALIANEVVLRVRPWTSLQPGCDVNCEHAEAGRLHRISRALEGDVAPLRKLLGK